MIGFAFLIGATVYELYAVVFKKQTISEFIWQMLDQSRTFKAFFFFVWVWLSVHFLAPEFFR